MIASLHGRVGSVSLNSAVVEVGGVGLEVQCTPSTLALLRVGHEARLATSLVVREDSLTLFGFAEPDEKALFELVQSASGVGPRLAQAMLAVHDPEPLRAAIAHSDVKVLTKVPGVGPKVAQRIILELKDKVGLVPVAASATVAPPMAWRTQVQAGLVGLGYSIKQADDVLDQIAADSAAGSADVAAMLRLALQALKRG